MELCRCSAGVSPAMLGFSMAGGTPALPLQRLSSLEGWNTSAGYFLSLSWFWFLAVIACSLFHLSSLIWPVCNLLLHTQAGFIPAWVVLGVWARLSLGQQSQNRLLRHIGLGQHRRPGLLQDIESSEIGAFGCDIDIRDPAVCGLQIHLVDRQHVCREG